MPTSRRSTFPVAILALVATLAALAGSEATAAAPKVGAAAPEFRLQDQAGKWVTLQEQRGKWVVLYFYPKDNTPGCTTQACGFRDDIFAFRRANATILGISVDDVESHDKFAKEHSLPFSILADSSKQTTKTYGVLYRALGLFEMAHRETFIIDPQGRIAKHYADVDTEGHSKLVLTDLKKLQGG
ncbi:MAG: peroxiredoxin [Steroidobacteraceae bacterium]|jgi:peroxiredoxin Q/BCP|nr:peroxiredoxin [Gammaproteobacteria bacterium]